jgi:23S rRNA pseudouridine1911/1915/1917 synthase
VKRFKNHSHITCLLETGRTHQIRVHMAHLRYPLVGDTLYGGRPKLPKGASTELIDVLRGFKRQALHARRLELEHPMTGEWMEFESEWPEDMVGLLAVLAKEG